MTPSTIINQASADGVIITMPASGSLKAKGDLDQVNKWLPIFREHKAGIIMLLTEVGNYTNSDYISTIISQAVVHADPSDDRHTCRQCANLSYSGACSVARPGGAVSAKNGYTPGQTFREQPHRCEGYAAKH